MTILLRGLVLPECGTLLTGTLLFDSHTSHVALATGAALAIGAEAFIVRTHAKAEAIEKGLLLWDLLWGISDFI